MDKVGEVMEVRDLAADLEMCEKETWLMSEWTPEEMVDAGNYIEPPVYEPPAVYYHDPKYKYKNHKTGEETDVCGFTVPSNEMAEFIATARTALPHAIHRAIAAEARVRVLENALRYCVKWLGTSQVQCAFTVSAIHDYGQVTKEFSDWAGSVWEIARQALEGGTPDE